MYFYHSRDSAFLYRLHVGTVLMEPKCQQTLREAFSFIFTLSLLKEEQVKPLEAVCKVFKL